MQSEGGCLVDADSNVAVSSFLVQQFSPDSIVRLGAEFGDVVIAAESNCVILED